MFIDLIKRVYNVISQIVINNIYSFKKRLFLFGSH